MERTYVFVLAKLSESTADHLVTGVERPVREGWIFSHQVADPRLLVTGVLLVVEGEDLVPVEGLEQTHALEALPVPVRHGQVPQGHQVNWRYRLPVEPAGIAIAVRYQKGLVFSAHGGELAGPALTDAHVVIANVHYFAQLEDAVHLAAGELEVFGVSGQQIGVGGGIEGGLL